MTTVVKTRLAAALAVIVAVGVLTFLSFGGIEENLVYYWTPGELLAKGESAKLATVRLGGVVAVGTVDWNPDTLELRFSAADQSGDVGDKNPAVAVMAKGAPPQMFREGIGVVVEGRYDGAVFRADRVMVKHSNEYQAPEAGEQPANAMNTLAAE
jgi:cytochrome c-type biogenesis protein CcmE